MGDFLSRYLHDPCGTSSIPYGKAVSVAVPETMRIVHARDLDESMLADFCDEPYFRLLHDLRCIPEIRLPAYRIRTAAPSDLPILADLINRSYTDLSVTPEYLLALTQSRVYDPALWILAADRDGKPVACGIAELDPDIPEGALEWIQVLPEYRRLGIGTLLVTELLRRLQGKARFATVSGKVLSPSCPQALYRRCGFTGDDVWHILTKK